MEPGSGPPSSGPHTPGPSLWPAGFAVGIACTLVGLIVSWPAAAAGVAITVLFGFLWIRDLSGGYRSREVPQIEPERRSVGDANGAADSTPAVGMPRLAAPETPTFPRNKFLEVSTLGLGGLIGAVVTLPVVGFSIGPAFLDQGKDDQDVGAVDDFPEGEWRITSFFTDPEAGEVSRRTAYVRHNGMLGDVPSVTIVSSRCAHLGCPVQPNGPVDDEATETQNTDQGEVTRIPTQPSGFGCPCHGGQYDTEGNRTAGPPVRALDRYEYRIRNDRLLLGDTYSVGGVDGEGKDAKISKYRLATPGVHIDGIEQLLYPIPVPK